MKRHLRGVSFIVCTFLVYFVLVAFVVTCSFLLFFSHMGIETEDVRSAATYTFINVLFLTSLFTAIDLIRRKLTVERPVREIKRALDRIMKGDFSVRLNASGSPSRFSDIMESINRMTEELSSVETLKTDFIANVSHEMKTPLAVIRNYASLLRTEGLSEEERIEYARAVEDGCKRLSDLMTNILKLNRLEKQQIYPEFTEYDLSEQLCEALLAYERVWEEKEIDIETDIEDAVTVKADAELLSLVWNNLLSNAFKFTEKGGKVSLSVKSEMDCAVVSVSDTGCGMTPEVGAHIFEKFYQGDTSHATQGNGLGLALVRRVVDILHGEIDVESVYGEGSTFTVRIRR